VRGAKSEVVGIGAVVEKVFEGGRDVLQKYNVPIEAVVTVTSMENGTISFD